MDLQKRVGKNSALPGIPRFGPMTNDRRAVYLETHPESHLLRFAAWDFGEST